MTQKLDGERSLMRIFLGELDRCQAGTHSGRPLHEAILLTLRDEGCAGATVVRAIAGFGASAGPSHRQRAQALAGPSDHHRGRGHGRKTARGVAHTRWHDRRGAHHPRESTRHPLPAGCRRRLAIGRLVRTDDFVHLPAAVRGHADEAAGDPGEHARATRAPAHSNGGAAMTISRRDAICRSSSALAGLSVGVLTAEQLQAQAPPQEWPDRLVEGTPREGFPAALPLNPDGSAPEHPERAAGPITDPLMWRTPDRQTPEIEFDYEKMAIRVDTRRLARLSGTLHFSDLEPLPPRFPHLPIAVRRAQSQRRSEVDGSPFQRFCGHARPRARCALLPLRGLRPVLRRRVGPDPHASAGDAGLAHERRADSAEARCPSAIDHSLPVWEPEHQGDSGDHVQHPGSSYAAVARLIVLDHRDWRGHTS